MTFNSLSPRLLLKHLPKTLVVQAERYASDGFTVLDHHVEAVFVIHDGPQAHDGDVDVVLRFPHLPFNE